MRWVACLSLVLFFAGAASAAIPTLVVEGDDGNVALHLSAVSIRVTVRGHLARTEYELTYRNSLDRVTGGDFTFPLPPDAEVSDLGLYFDGKLRRAVAVERVLARTAYEEIVHRNVDPAIAEWGTGRSFKLDIYPIPEKGEKKVYIAYDQELTADDYVLDVSYRAKVGRFDVKIDSGGAAVREENGVIRIVRDPHPTAFAARSPEDGKWYASAALDFAPSPREAPPAAHTLILYDTSSSSVQQDHARVRRFLTEFLARQQAWSAAEIVPFHIDLDEPRRIANAAQPAAARELERVLGDLQPLGATNLMAVAARLPAMVNALPPSTRVVLVTDGMTSLGDSGNVAAAVGRLAALGRPLLIVHATKTADDHLLAKAAHATGGWSIDLLRTEVDDAVEQAMDLPSAIRLEGLTPALLRVAGKARIAVAARGRDPITAVGGVPARELHEDVEAGMVRRAWARARLREMLVEGVPDEELIAHGRVYTQLTPRTSLLVLESFWDYEQYDIPLPPDLVAEKAKWEREQAVLRVQRIHPPLPPPNVTLGGWFVRGRILDVTGAPLPGVVVRLLDGGFTVASAVTDVHGIYAVGAAAMPKDATIVADLPGFGETRARLDGETPRGAVMDLLLRMTAVSEAITVTAEAPTIEVMRSGVAANAQASLRTGGVTTDDLLAHIATQSSPDSDDPDVRAAVARQRRALRAAVIEKLRGIGATSERLRYYLSARGLLGGDKGFHVFAAEVFRERSPEVAARVLSDLAEARPDDAPLLRFLARVLDGWGEGTLARLLLERAIEIAPTEPQSWREMILVEARHGRVSSVLSWGKRLAALQQRDGMDAVYEQTEEALARWFEKASFADRLRGIDVRADEADDLTIDLMYDSGWAYVDLHVTEPNGRVVSWSNPDDAGGGGKLSGGYTFGYGPQIYTIRNAPRGAFHVAMDYYSADETNVSLESLVHVIVQRRGERRDYFFVMNEEKEKHPLTTIELR